MGRGSSFVLFALLAFLSSVFFFMFSLPKISGMGLPRPLDLPLLKGDNYSGEYL